MYTIYLIIIVKVIYKSTPAPYEAEKRSAACDQVGQLHTVLIKSYNASLYYFTYMKGFHQPHHDHPQADQ